jgi:nucleotide-binding universal stress UspA family protein
MFKHVLVPLDGSREAEKALSVATQLVRASGGSLILVRAVRAPVEFELGVAPPATWAPAAQPEEREEARAYLEAMRLDPTLAGLPTTAAVYAGPPATMILAAAASYEADLIVLTSHGRTGIARWLLGSVAAALARESPIPTLVLRGSGLGDAQAAQNEPLSALIPLDGSRLAEAAIRPALQLLGALAGSAPVALRLLSVVQPLPLTETAPLVGGVPGEGQILLTEVDKTMLGEAEEYLCSKAEQIQRESTQLLPGQALRVTWSAVWNPDVAGAIISIATSGHELAGSAGQTSRLAPSTLVALATHGHGGLQRWAMGSVADRVLNATTLPMLVVRPEGSNRQQETDKP